MITKIKLALWISFLRSRFECTISSLLRWLIGVSSLGLGSWFKW
jgi:hypothetical protein